MTLIYSQQFLQGIVLVADSRSSKVDTAGKYDAWRDNTQKIFRIKDHTFISFCGDIEFAGVIIQFLIRQVHEKSQLANIHVFYRKAPKLIKFAYEQLARVLNRRPLVEFIIAGVDFSRPELIKENGKIVGHIGNVFDKKAFKISCPKFEIKESGFLNHSQLIGGSGTPALEEGLATDLQGLYNFGGIGPLDYHGMLISGALKENAEKLGIDTVGGLFQIVVIDQNGSRFVGYKSRSKEHEDPNTLDLEMALRNGRWVQKNLKTGKETPLLYPPEIIDAIKINDSPELFALLE
ncbi:MAG: hypothetical protein WA051_02125 [Minisyncoccia bacterium]